MSSIVVDTNILSYELKRDTRARLYARHLHDRTLAISYVTLAELALWVNRRNWGVPRRSEMSGLLQRYYVIYPNRDICQIWAKVTLECERSGRRISENDAWIAACAIHFNAPLVTHNPKDFESVPDLHVISETGSSL